MTSAIANLLSKADILFSRRPDHESILAAILTDEMRTVIPIPCPFPFSSALCTTER